MTPQRIDELKFYVEMKTLGHEVVQECITEIEKLRCALENIRFSGLSQGWAGDKTTPEEHKNYSIDVAGEALGLNQEEK